MIQGSPSNVEELEVLERHIRRARRFVWQSEIKVEEIEASFYSFEKFYPKIKILRPRAQRPMTEQVFHDFAEQTR